MNIPSELKKVDEEIGWAENAVFMFAHDPENRKKIEEEVRVLKMRRALLEVLHNTSGYFGSHNAIVDRVRGFAKEGLGYDK